MYGIGYNIKKHREAMNLTQNQLGEIIGVSGVAIMRYEKEQREPKFETICRIAAALGVNPSDLVPSLTVNLGTDIIYMNDNGETVTVDANSSVGVALSVLNMIGSENMKRLDSAAAGLSNDERTLCVDRFVETSELVKFKKSTEEKK